MVMQLKNKYLKLDIFEAGEVYKRARFDWTGQIAQVTFQDRHTFCTSESLKFWQIKKLGQGLVAEFGLALPVGYDDCEVGQWFPKIGVGLLLKKTKKNYNFFKNYKIRPFSFSMEQSNNAAVFNCHAQEVRGYACKLIKTIRLKDKGFMIDYELSNVGSKRIITNEYNHNFLAIDRKNIDHNYVLKFPFTINPSTFSKIHNPSGVLSIDGQNITWKAIPRKDFFISHLNPAPLQGGSWALEHKNSKVGIRETCEFPIRQINLWGKKHVVSPEIYYEISLAPGETLHWQRSYEIYEL
jgi:hypothetical protein